MSGHAIFEDTWEQVKLFDQSLAGRRVKIQVEALPSTPQKSVKSSERQLEGYGKFKGLIGGTQAFLSEKHREIELEEKG